MYGLIAAPGTNAPRTLTASDFAGGRCWVIPPGQHTPKQLVVGVLAVHAAPVAKGERVLIDLPDKFQQIGLAVFLGGQHFEVIHGGLYVEPEDDNGGDGD